MLLSPKGEEGTRGEGKKRQEAGKDGAGADLTTRKSSTSRKFSIAHQKYGIKHRVGGEGTGKRGGVRGSQTSVKSRGYRQLLPGRRRRRLGQELKKEERGGNGRGREGEKEGRPSRGKRRRTAS